MLKTLQAGRGLAALAILAFHLSICMGLPRYGGRAVFFDTTTYGALGVDFFFVLSGFIILYAHAADLGRPARWGRYLYRRFVRVYPVYWLYSALLLFAVLAGLTAEKGLPPSASAWLADVTLVRFSGETPILGQTWTLFHEIAFYAVFSTLLLNRKVGMILMAIWAAVCLVTFHLDGEGRHGAWIDYTAAYNLYFFVGMGACFAFRKGWIGLWGAPLGVAVIVGAWVAGGRGALWTLPLLAVGFFLLIAGAATAEQRQGLPVPKLLLLIGNASYSIYLVHEEVALLCLKLLTALHAETWLRGEGVYLVSFAVTVAVGVAAYLLIERPLVRLLQRRALQASAAGGGPANVPARA